MNIEAELKKDGIEVIEKLDTFTINSIAQKVSSELYQTFPNYGFDKKDLFSKLARLDMYKAKMPNRNV